LFILKHDSPLGGASFKVRQLSNSSAKSDSCLTFQLAPPSGQSCFRMNNYMFIQQKSCEILMTYEFTYVRTSEPAALKGCHGQWGELVTTAVALWLAFARNFWKGPKQVVCYSILHQSIYIYIYLYSLSCCCCCCCFLLFLSESRVFCFCFSPCTSPCKSQVGPK
jgi:hypothetical protein